MANTHRLPSTPRGRWLGATLLIGSGVLGWLGAFGVNRVGAGYLKMPEGAALLDLSTATQVGGSPPGQDAGPRGPADGEGPQAPPPEGEPGPGEDTSVANNTGGRADFVEPIVKRNIFDSAKVDQPTTGTEEVGEGEHRTDLKVTLLARVVAWPEEFSSALIAEEKGQAQGYGVGDPLVGEATILRIEQKKVFIRRNDGAVEYLDMEGNKPPSDNASAAAPSDDSGVASSGDNRFTVDKATLDQALANPEALASQMRVMPHKGADGEVDGYRLSGIRRGSLMEKLGIKNGDIVHSVNGKQLNSTSAAMNAYQTLQSESGFSFEISRRNKNQTMQYDVR